MSKALKRAAAAVCAVVFIASAALSLCASKAPARIDFTESERDFIASCGKLRVGYVCDRKPVSFEDGEGNFAGISRYILDRVSELCGIEFEYVPLPTGDVTYQYLLENRLDLVSSVEYNEENLRANGIMISKPYLSSRKVVVGREGLEFAFDKDLSIAISTGSQTLRKVLGASYPNFKLVDYPSVPDCFNAVLTGEADLLMLNQYVVEYWMSKPIYERLKAIPVLGLDDRLCFSAVIALDGSESGNSEELGGTVIDILNKAIDGMSEDEVGSFMIQGVMENQYRYNFGDFLYRYRMAVRVSVIFALVILLLLWLLIRLRLRYAENKADARIKSRFLSTMSHEIRTPLNGIIGLNMLMSEKTGDPDKLKEYLRQSDVTAKYLLTIVNDMLDMSAIEQGSIELENNPVDLDLVLGAVNSIAENAMASKGINYTHTFDLEWKYLYGDNVRIQQVLLHLLDNARKFTRKGGRVTFEVSQHLSAGEKIITTASVTDTGRGMSEEFQKYIFNAFSREPDSVSKGNQGTGLGLSISRSLAKMMGGDLTFESERGKGSRFIFTFSSEPAEPEESAPAPSGGSAASSKKVLVAEDNELNAEIVVELLHEYGFETEHAENGRRALEIFSSSEPNSFGAVLMDLLMPEMDGFEAAKAIRGLDREDAGSVRIIACSANSSSEDREKARESGMDGFVTKPVDVRALLRTLNGAGRQ